MSFEALLIHTITVFHYDEGAVDRYNNIVPSFDEGTVYRARVQSEQTVLRETTNEYLNDRDTRISFFTAWLEPAAVVGSLDEAEFDGVRHRIVGDPEKVYDGVGQHHWEVVLQRIAG